MLDPFALLIFGGLAFIAYVVSQTKPQNPPEELYYLYTDSINAPEFVL